MTYDELEAVFSRHLNFDNEPNELLSCVSVVLSNRLDSQPVWMFLVGPSSSLKSSILKTMEDSQEIYMVSSLSEHSLLSGFKDRRGRDQSLLPLLNGKTLIVKDFTTILSMRHDTRGAIFGQLRDAYDGFASRGTGVGTISHRAKFGILAGSTSAIEEMRSTENLLGERFLYFKNTQPDSERTYDRILRNLGVDSVINSELKEAMTTFLDSISIPCSISIQRPVMQILSRWSMRVVMMRTSARRDQYTRQITLPVEQSEFGGRFLTQISTLYYALTCLVDEDRAMRVVRKIVLDAIPYTRQLVVRSMMAGIKGRRQLSQEVKVSPMTIQRVVEELKFLGIIDDQENVSREYDEFFSEIVW